MVLPVSQKTYFVCTIPDVSEFLLSLRQKIRQKLIAVIKGGQLCSDNARILTFILPIYFGGLTIPLLYDSLKTVRENSWKIAKHLSKLKHLQKVKKSLNAINQKWGVSN